MGMRVGIDASNIRGGGGVTHLVELLRAASPATEPFSSIVVWAGKSTLDKIEERPWIERRHVRLLDGSLGIRALWQRYCLPREAKASECDVLYIPGGTFFGGFSPVVTFCQNLLPFEPDEIRAYGLSWMGMKLRLLRVSQEAGIRRSDGVIHLTKYAEQSIGQEIGYFPENAAIVPHGIDERFFAEPRPQRPISDFSLENPYKILYVSQIDMYKHQWVVAEAVAALRAEGVPVMLELIGAAYRPAERRLKKALVALDPQGEFIFYRGSLSHREISDSYRAADLFVFASSCETFGQVVLEAMASGLPIVCSSASALPEVVGEGAVYFSPRDAVSLKRSLGQVINSPTLRTQLGMAAFIRAREFSWARCASETMVFIRACLRPAANVSV